MEEAIAQYGENSKDWLPKFFEINKLKQKEKDAEKDAEIIPQNTDQKK
jgi:hypothetical protein